MSKILIEESTLEDIADAIRAMNGLSTTYKPSEMTLGIRDGLRNLNLNLACNGDFVHPIRTGDVTVNFQGKRMVVRGWYLSAEDHHVTITSDGLRCSTTGSTSSAFNIFNVLKIWSDHPTETIGTVQIVPAILVNSTLTLSAIVNGEFKSTTFIYKDDGTMTGNSIYYPAVSADSRDVQVGLNRDSSNRIAVYAYSPEESSDKYFTISAVKVELGSKSSLIFDTDPTSGMATPVLNANQSIFDSMFGYQICEYW